MWTAERLERSELMTALSGEDWTERSTTFESGNEKERRRKKRQRRLLALRRSKVKLKFVFFMECEIKCEGEN